MSTETTATLLGLRISADLPGLPGIPAEIGPARCFTCDELAGTIRHHRRSDGSVDATLVCLACGSAFDLRVRDDAYLMGLTIGRMIEAARHTERAGLADLTRRVEALEADTPAARQLELEADQAAADLTASGYGWPGDRPGEYDPDPFGADPDLDRERLADGD
jgi:hypothetical protein